MKRQLELRQEETKAIHKCVAPLYWGTVPFLMTCIRKCDDLEARIEAIRQASKNEASVPREQKPAAVAQGSRSQQLQATVGSFWCHLNALLISSSAESINRV